jgi:hypothetical protein
MGYDLHITRKPLWLDAAPAIDLHEWLKYVASDPDLKHEGFAEAPVAGGGVLRVENFGTCIWKGYSRGANPESTAWFTWSLGNIVAKNPDQEIRRKMWSIAQALQARVQGDEGEHYGEDGEMIGASSDNASSRLHAHPVESKRPWWKFW